MSVFDPLGFLTPFTMQSRILMQEIWLSKIKWDAELRESEFKKWSEWLRELDAVKNCRIERCYQLLEFQSDSAELHVFCDASSKAYASVAYWRFAQKDGTFRVSIIMAKGRVAPVKPTTIPRLELQAALLGTKIAKLIGDEHEFRITRRTFWSDSITVLRLIKREPRTFKIFVANRLGEISENSKEEEWRWVPTSENPADDGTRLAPDSLKKGSRWLLGPPFLRLAETEWPKENFVNFDENSDCDEIRKVAVNVNSVWTPLIDFSRFSNFNRLVATVSLVCLVCEKMRKREKTKFDLFERAKAICIQQSQHLSFSREINDLENHKPVAKDSRTLTLNPFLDKHGILRANGRIEKFSENMSLAKPIILDKNETFTKLLIQHFHERYYHGSHETVINEIRQHYWIIGLRQALRSLTSKCIVCRMLRAPSANPRMAALPFARMAYRLRPFSHCGLDYFGPMMVKIGRRREKRWGALFTCMTTRAIHLELVHTLSTDSVIMALKRFISRRGVPLCLYSDNGTNFRGAAKELNQAAKELSKQKLVDFAARNAITTRTFSLSMLRKGHRDRGTSGFLCGRACYRGD